MELDEIYRRYFSGGNAPVAADAGSRDEGRAAS
jgi:hypothetical protein